MKVETIDNSIFISSKTDKTMFFLNFIDDETANKATTIMQEIIAEKKISSLEEMIVFLDFEKLSYQTGDKFLMSAAFVEEYLVPKYGIKPGSKIKNQDNTFVSLSHNWNSKKQNYDYITEIYKDCTKILSDWNSKEKKYNDLLIFYSDHLDKYKEWNPAQKQYNFWFSIYKDHSIVRRKPNKNKKNWDYKLITYADRTEQYTNFNPETKFYSSRTVMLCDHISQSSNWNKNTNWYDYCLETFSDNIIERKNWNPEKKTYDFMLSTFPNHTEKCSEWNPEKGWYDYILATYSDYSKEVKNWNKETKEYEYCIERYNDHTVEYKGWNTKLGCFDSTLWTYSDHTEEYKNWTKKAKGYNYLIITETGGLVIEAKDINSKTEAYASVTIKIGNTVCKFKNHGDNTYTYTENSGKYESIVHYDTHENGKSDITIIRDKVIQEFIGIAIYNKEESIPFDSYSITENGFTKTEGAGKISMKEFEKLLRPVPFVLAVRLKYHLC